MTDLVGKDKNELIQEKIQEQILQFRDIRLKERLSQSEISRRTRIPQRTISRMENGLAVPTLESFYKIAESMGYELELKLEKKK